jgi:hypothetical protein
VVVPALTAGKQQAPASKAMAASSRGQLLQVPCKTTHQPLQYSNTAKTFVVQSILLIALNNTFTAVMVHRSSTMRMLAGVHPL